MKPILTIILFFSVFSLYAVESTLSLQYLIREPKVKSEKPPLLILLHGIGSNEKDLFALAAKMPGKYRVISARAPIKLDTNSYAWFHRDLATGKPVISIEEEEQSRKLIIKFIEELKVKYHLDKNEIYLCGFSQGAIMSYSVALTKPELITGIAVMSGRILEEIKPKVVSKERLHHLKIFISHGTDDKVIAIEFAKAANVFLKSKELTPIFKEYSSAGHEINPAMLADLIAWLK